MKAGSTNTECGTKIKIISSDDPDIIGLTGEITHPFLGIMWPGVTYVAGVRLDEDNKGLFSNGIINLTAQDQYEVIT